MSYTGDPGVRHQWPYVTGLCVLWVVSRIAYHHFFGVRFNAGTLDSYLQFVDPRLLRDALVESVFYLRDQPPGFNLFLGAVLKISGAHAEVVFQVLYGICGLALLLAVWHLMRRMEVAPAVAFVVTSILVLSPVTVLYENWLFYTYPLALLLCLAALWLHRYLESGKTGDAVVFFSLMAIVVATRGVFHLAWFVVVFGGVLLVRPMCQRQILLSAAIPCLLLLALYVKNYLVFGEWFTGKVYRDANYAEMVLRNVPMVTRHRLVAEGQVSGIVNVPLFQKDFEAYRPFLPVVEKTGVPVLDAELKSTGYPNWQSLTMREVGKLLRANAKVVSGLYPESWWKSVRMNLEEYFLPADEMYIFRYGDTNAQSLARPLEILHTLAGQRAVGNVAWLYLIGLPALFVFGAASLWRRRGRGELDRPTSAVLAFLLFNIGYLAAVTILFSIGEQSRYRYKVDPLYAVLCAMMVTSVLRTVAAHARPGPADQAGEARPGPTDQAEVSN